MMPVIRELQSCGWARCVVVVTAQHRDLLDQMLTRFDIAVDYDLNIMQPAQSLNKVLSCILPELELVIQKEQPCAVLAQGDTATVFGAALAAFHAKIPFGHIEAGLRTYNLQQPFPEEGYRQMVSRIARWHFAPTVAAVQLLHAEGIAPNNIYMTGNTCIDTLLQTVTALPPLEHQPHRIILLTAHRRENFGAPLQSILQAALHLVERFADVRLIYPVHPNPNVKTLAQKILSGHPRISLIPPQDYFDFVDLMRKATLILTDSGGIQEEAPSLGKPVLVLRETTERPEAVIAGTCKLVGTEAQAIETAAAELLEQPDAYRAMAGSGYSPFGDGKAARRIVQTLKATL